MYRRALIALDMSQAESALLGCLAELKQFGVEELVLTHIIKVGYAQGAGVGHEDDLQAWLEAHAAPLREAGFKVDVVVREGADVADTLLAVTDEKKADLLVTGSRSESRIKTLFLGSVARKLLRRATLPVLLVWMEPGKGENQDGCELACRTMLSHPLLVTDFSDKSVGAVQAAVALARKSGKVDSLHVSRGATGTEQAKLDVVASRFPETERGRTILETGEVADTIAAVAKREDNSLIIMGRHGRGWKAGNLFGSTAAELCEMAGKPVLVVA